MLSPEHFTTLFRVHGLVSSGLPRDGPDWPRQGGVSASCVLGWDLHAARAFLKGRPVVEVRSEIARGGLVIASTFRPSNGNGQPRFIGLRRTYLGRDLIDSRVWSDR